MKTVLIVLMMVFCVTGWAEEYVEEYFEVVDAEGLLSITEVASAESPVFMDDETGEVARVWWENGELKAEGNLDLAARLLFERFGNLCNCKEDDGYLVLVEEVDWGSCGRGDWSYALNTGFSSGFNSGNICQNSSLIYKEFESMEGLNEYLKRWEDGSPMFAGWKASQDDKIIGIYRIEKIPFKENWEEKTKTETHEETKTDRRLRGIILTNNKEEANEDD